MKGVETPCFVTDRILSFDGTSVVVDVKRIFLLSTRLSSMACTVILIILFMSRVVRLGRDVLFFELFTKLTSEPTTFW